MSKLSKCFLTALHTSAFACTRQPKCMPHCPRQHLHADVSIHACMSRHDNALRRGCMLTSAYMRACQSMTMHLHEVALLTSSCCAELCFNVGRKVRVVADDTAYYTADIRTSGAHGYLTHGRSRKLNNEQQENAG